jgi:hypothetical protein
MQQIVHDGGDDERRDKNNEQQSEGHNEPAPAHRGGLARQRLLVAVSQRRR